MKNKKIKLFALLLLGINIATNAQTILYVDASKVDNSGIGNTWSTAKKDLQIAIGLANSEDTIWVKTGTYKPIEDPFGNTAPTDDRDKTFYLKDRIKIFGGFAGNETNFNQRNVAANPTILSGDIGIVNDASDNCYHILLAAFTTITPTTMVDGFTIKDGNANVNTTLTVNTIAVNRSLGAAIYTRNGNNTFSNNNFINNTAIVGGSIYAGATPTTTGTTNTISNNSFSNNLATSGGGVYAVLCNTFFTNNTFNNNSSTNGAALYTNSGINIFKTNTFSNNTATNNGGGMYVSSGTNTCINNVCSNNTANNNGGGMYISGGTDTVTNNLLVGNTAANGGGMFASGFVTANNNTITNNTATTNGGGLFTNSCNNTKFSNNILWDNKKINNAAVQGADYFEGATNGNTFYNNLLQLVSTNYTTTGSGAYDLGAAAAGNIFATDASFVNASDPDGADNIWRTADDGLQLNANSPAINTGSTAISTPIADITGKVRGILPFEIGAYEWFTCSGNAGLYVDESVAITGTGKTWATAYKTLDEALFEAYSCLNITTINVAKGTYKPTQKPHQNGVYITTADVRDVSFYLRDGLALFGGFPTGGGLRNIANNPTILSGDIGVVNDVSDNCYHVLLAAFATISPTTMVDGFTIKDGNANVNTTLTVNTVAVNRSLGAAIYTRNGTNTFANNNFTNNTAVLGGSIYAGATPITTGTTNIFSSNSFSNNSATSGGAVYAVLCNTFFTNNTFNSNSGTNGAGLYTNTGINIFKTNTFSNNTATNNGGGMYVSSGTNTFINNVCNINTANNNGGGMYISGGTDTVINNLLINNTAANGGGMFASGFITATNNTLVGNNATTNGGGLFTNSCNNTKFTNNIFWNNKKINNATVQGADYFEGAINGNTFYNNLLQLDNTNYTTTGSGAYDLGAAAVGNNFATDPSFINATDPDGVDNIWRTTDDGLRINCGSIVKNKGRGNSPTTDILGGSRNGILDMGAYEANGTIMANTLPTLFTAVNIYQTPNSEVDYTDCTNQLIKLNGSIPSYNVSGDVAAKVWLETAQSSSFVKRHYEITPANNAANATAKITLYFLQQEFTDFNAVSGTKLPIDAIDIANNKANLRIKKYTGSSIDGTGLPNSYTGNIVEIDPLDADIVWNNTANRWEVSFDVTGFSGFFAGVTIGALPLHLLNFSGSKKSDYIALQWKTADEVNTKLFELQSSNDGINFTTIISLYANGGSTNTYNYLDYKNANSNKVFYRLKMIDTDGRFTYSPIIHFNNTGNNVEVVSIYPNPVSGILNISIGDTYLNTFAHLYDVKGTLIQSILLTNNQVQINVDKLIAGIYLLKLNDGNVKKIIKK